jgi:hypothetical protein
VVAHEALVRRVEPLAQAGGPPGDAELEGQLTLGTQAGLEAVLPRHHLVGGEAPAVLTDHVPQVAQTSHDYSLPARTRSVTQETTPPMGRLKRTVRPSSLTTCTISTRRRRRVALTMMRPTVSGFWE